MANSVLSVIQPGGSIGTKYNIRSTGIRHFPQDQAAPYWSSGIRIPENGCCNYNRYTPTGGTGVRHAIRVKCNDITELWDGLTLSITIPQSDDYSKIDDGTLLKIDNGTATDSSGYITFKSLRTHSGLPLSTLKKGEIYIVQAHYATELGATEWIIYDTIKIGTDAGTTITSNNYLVPTGGAVYDYVNTMISQRWEVVLCTANPSGIPDGAIYISNVNSSPITGTLPASADTMYKIYLVKHVHSAEGTNTSSTSKDVYDEWITWSKRVGQEGSNQQTTYGWEKIGNTDIDTADIATQIADSIIGSIADHTVNEPTGIGTVDVGKHKHSINIEFEAEGKVTPIGTIAISHYEEPGYTMYKPTVTISSFTPSGSVASTFIGTVENVAFSGTMSTITMSTYNVPVNANNGNASLSIESQGHSSLSVRPIGTIIGTDFIPLELGDGNHNHTMPSVQVSIATIDFTNNSSVTISTKTSLGVSIITEPVSEAGENIISIPTNIRIDTQAEYRIIEEGLHSHLGTLSTVTAIATLSNVGSASVYSVENEILTLTPSVPPISTAAVTISQQPISISNGGNHAHTVTQETQATVAYDFKHYKLGGTTEAHSHRITGTYAGLIGTTVSSNTDSATHIHGYKLQGNAIAKTLSVSLSTIYMSGVIPHTHTVGTIILKSGYTPAGMLKQSQTIGDDPDGRIGDNPEVHPAGSSLSVKGNVSSTFTGTEVLPTATSEKVFFGFIGTGTPVTYNGQITGETEDATIGTKTVTVGVISTTLAHEQR